MTSARGVCLALLCAFALGFSCGDSNSDDDSNKQNATGSATTDGGDSASSKACVITEKVGPFDHYLMRDLPSGVCDSEGPCLVTTRDRCPDGDYPGPQIAWECRCEQRVWKCSEQSRSRAVCRQ